MKQTSIEKIREIWLEEQKLPDPTEAMEILEAEESYKIRKINESPTRGGSTG
jgi:hypothetical protein